MKHILRAIILLIILFIAAEYYRYNGNIVSLISVLSVIATMYLIAGIIGAIRKAIKSRNNTITTTNTINKNSGCSGLVVVLLLLALAYVFRSALGMYSARTVFFLDHLLQIGSVNSPVIFWGLLGLLVGSIYGSFVAWKKYKLNATINLIPVGVLVLVAAILYLANKPSYKTALNIAKNTQTAYAYHLVTAEVYNASPDNNTQYKPAFLLDSSDRTAWITDVAKGRAEVRFSFKGLENFAGKDLQCTGFIIKNGYRKSQQLWNNFARVKEIAIRHNGRFITTAIINNKNTGFEEIKIAPASVSSFDNFSISINDIYVGEKYSTRVAISELVPVIQYAQ